MLRSSIVSKPGLLTTMQQEVGTAQPGSCRHIWAASQFTSSRPYCRLWAGSHEALEWWEFTWQAGSHTVEER
jgi:hypothetical protein